MHLLGDDYTNPPPVHELSKRGVVDNVVGFSTFYSAENPPSAIIDAVASGKIDVAIVWGPAAGYFVKQQRVPLVMVPVPSAKAICPSSSTSRWASSRATTRCESIGESDRHAARGDHEDPERLQRSARREKAGLKR